MKFSAHQTERRRLKRIQAIQVENSNSFSKLTSAWKTYLFVIKLRFTVLLSLSSITCRNEYLALLTKRTRLHFLVAKFQDILRMSCPLKSV